jgi:hypothetical protein
LFTDSEFPPEINSLLDVEEINYKERLDAEDIDNFKKIIWKRASEIYGKDLKLMSKIA